MNNKFDNTAYLSDGDIDNKNAGGFLNCDQELFSPASRAYLAWQEGKISTAQYSRHQFGKFFSDNKVNISLQDANMANINHDDSFILPEPGLHWTKHHVISGGKLTATWNNKNKQCAYRWNYFITHRDWHPERPLSREQFEETPFYTVELATVAGGDSDNQLRVHELSLPERRGYHVLFAAMEDADGRYINYQIIDLFFILFAQQPPAPYGLRVTAVSKNSVSLTWDYPANPVVYKYEVYRNGKKLNTGGGSSLFFTDKEVKENTEYTYTVQAFTINGVDSPLSEPVTIRTLGGSNQVVPPEPPVDLQYSSLTNTSARLNWQPGSSEKEISNYVIYRNSIAVGNVTYPADSFLDTKLLPDTQYYYYVIAVSIYNLSSIPSETIFVKTRPEEEVQYRDWRPETFYPVGAKVYSLGHNWRCIKAHISFCVSGQPGKLWEEI